MKIVFPSLEIGFATEKAPFNIFESSAFVFSVVWRSKCDIEDFVERKTFVKHC